LSERDKNSVMEMVGEFLREIAVLVLVFVPLELFKGNMSLGWYLGVLAFSATLLASGICMERIRP
jgi:hypothetical protein